MAENKFLSFSEEETVAVGASLAASLVAKGVPYAFIAFYGEMGVGKTAFTRGFCQALGITGTHSPTYTVVNEYAGGKHPVYHFDMYRIEGEADLYSIGYDEYLSLDAYILCEWSENIENAIPSDAITVTIRRTDGESGREILIKYAD